MFPISLNKSDIAKWYIKTERKKLRDSWKSEHAVYSKAFISTKENIQDL